MSEDEIQIDPNAGDAVMSAYRAYESFASAKTPVDAAFALRELHDAMSDLASWLPGYNADTGEVEDVDPPGDKDQPGRLTADEVRRSTAQAGRLEQAEHEDPS